MHAVAARDLMAEAKVVTHSVEKDPLEIFRALSGETLPVLLQSARRDPRAGRFSLVASDPFMVLRFREGRGVLSSRSREEVFDGDPFAVLQEALDLCRVAPLPGIPFAGGAIGYLGYGLRCWTEARAIHATLPGRWPDMHLAFYDRAFVVDHVLKCTHLVVTGLPETGPSRRREKLRGDLRRLQRHYETRPEREQEAHDSHPQEPEFATSKEQYLRNILRAQEYLAAGDIYQVNLSHKIRMEGNWRPLALYHDRHGIFKQTSKATEADTLEEQLAGKQDPTQFGRLVEELEIASIAARSPQAKGRVERLFGTLQERLVVQLRLADAQTLEQANQVVTSYLPRFNAQFAVAPTQEGSAYRPLQETLHAADLFCFKYLRIVASDNTISFAKQCLQLLPDAQRRSYAKARVQVHEHFDGHLSVHLSGRCVAITVAPLETTKMRTRSGPRGGIDVSLDTQTPSSAVVLLNQASTAELGESEVSHVNQSAVTNRPAATHPWRKPWIQSKRTKSLDT